MAWTEITRPKYRRDGLRYVGVQVHPADIQDRNGAIGVIASLYPWLRHLFADGGYAGEKLTAALQPLGT